MHARIRWRWIAFNASHLQHSWSGNHAPLPCALVSSAQAGGTCRDGVILCRTGTAFAVDIPGLPNKYATYLTARHLFHGSRGERAQRCELVNNDGKNVRMVCAFHHKTLDVSIIFRASITNGRISEVGGMRPEFTDLMVIGFPAVNRVASNPCSRLFRHRTTPKGSLLPRYLTTESRRA